MVGGVGGAGGKRGDPLVGHVEFLVAVAPAAEVAPKLDERRISGAAGLHQVELSAFLTKPPFDDG